MHRLSFTFFLCCLLSCVFSPAFGIPEKVEILNLNFEKTLGSAKSGSLKNFELLVMQYTRNDQKVRAADAKRAHDLLEKNKANPDQNLPREVKMVLKQWKEQKEKITGVYLAELERLRAGYGEAGDLDAVDELNLLIAQLNLQRGKVEGMAEITVKATVPAMFAGLRKGSERLSGDSQHVFKTINSSIRSGVFTRVPPKSTPQYVIQARTKGNIIVAVNRDHKSEVPEPKEEVKGFVTGPRLDRFIFYRVYLENRGKYSFKGYEAFVVAKRLHRR